MRTLVIDTSVLIDFLKVQRLELLAALPDTECLITEDILDEVTHTEQRSLLNDAITRGYIAPIRVDSPDELQTFANLSGIGNGERSAFAVAFHRGFTVAIEDSTALRRARTKLGSIPTLSLIDIVRELVAANVLSLPQADALLREWQTDPKFRYPHLTSFADAP